ncbi:hypothetical protein Tasa_007_030 [Tanticharoenia sakaeratensis NBRC 103193]|uniref:TonB C-terminal domain-containing protein n=2 Tax=Tanticharoenia TaxID=444052 RepID=A0A0D6MI83_9PROT|nr:hypothetical protein Tasa_007_030 [Tanticharoenia sakaeratensis NBRC 103193]
MPPALPAPNHALSGASDGARAPLACAPVAQRGTARAIGLEVAIGLHLVALAALLALHSAHPVVPPDAAVQMVFEPTPPAPLKALPPPPVMPATPDAVALPAVPQPAPDLPPAPVWHHLRALPIAPRAPAHAQPAQPAHRTPGTSSAVPDTHRTANPMPETAPSTSQATPVAPPHMTAPACDAASAPYPASARVLHEQGVVRVGLTVQPGGAVTHAHVTDSSGYDDLDDAALAAARTLTCRNTGTVSADVTLPVRFTLH